MNGTTMTNNPQATPDPTTPKPPWAWMVGIAAIVVLVAIIAVAQDDSTPPDDGPISALPAADATVTVVYEVEGTTDYASVTMQTPTGTSQISPDVPMTRKSDGQPGLEMEFASGAFVYLSAQNQRGYGTIICRITVDGVVVSENSASGGYAIASCKGTA